VYSRLSVPFRRGRLRAFRKRRNLILPKSGKLLSLMARSLVRPALLTVILLSLVLSTGCSGLLGGPYDQANGLVDEANEAIEEHNRLFEEARVAYEEAREAVEVGEDASDEAEHIAQARETMQEARDELEEAREPLSEVRPLDVELEIEEYARSLSEAVNTQISAEGQEIDFYELLEQDPTLENGRTEAEDFLSEVDEGYEEAEEAYERAQEIADANPELLRRRY
jgi:tetratricopeptide (TPR) repeat protein